MHLLIKVLTCEGNLKGIVGEFDLFATLVARKDKLSANKLGPRKAKDFLDEHTAMSSIILLLMINDG